MRDVSNKEYEEAIANEDNLNIAKFVVSMYKTIPRDEAEQLVYYAVWEALRRFDYTQKECKFTSYLYRCARWVCASYIKSKAKEKRHYTLNENVPELESASHLEKRIIDLKADLSDDEFQLLHDRFIGGYLLKEIAEKRDISVEWARLKIERLLETVHNRG